MAPYFIKKIKIISFFYIFLKLKYFHKGWIKRRPFLFYEKENIQAVNTYLGVNFSASGSFWPFCKNLIKKGTGTTEVITGVLGTARSDMWDNKMKLYEAVVLPSVMHWLEVWGLGCAEAIERVQLHFLKKILLLDKQYYSKPVSETRNWQIKTGAFNISKILVKSLIKILRMSDSIPSDLFFSLDKFLLIFLK